MLEVIVDYYKHYASEKIAWRMSAMGIHHIFDYVESFPPSLLPDLQKHRAELYIRHKLALEELRHIPPLLRLFSAPLRRAAGHNE